MLYIYWSWDPVNWVSVESRIIKEGQIELFERGSIYKFDVFLKDSRTNKEKLLTNTKLWQSPKKLIVSRYDTILEYNLDNYAPELKTCLKRKQRAKEMDSNGTTDLYKLLKIDQRELRRVPAQEQKKMIKDGWKQQMLQNHPDKGGDVEHCQHLNNVYQLLMNDESRAAFHNEFDYAQGWFSMARWRSIFSPEYGSEEQRKMYERKWWMTIGSLGAVGAGMTVTALTAGATAPLMLYGGAAAGTGLVVGGTQSCYRANSGDSFREVCSTKEYLTSFGIGLVAGGVAGAASAGITNVVLGGAAIGEEAVTVSQVLQAAGGVGAVDDVCTSLAIDAERILLDGEKMSIKDVAMNATVGGLIGGCAGFAGGMVAKPLRKVADKADDVLKGVKRLEVDSVKTGVKSVDVKLKKALEYGVEKAMDLPDNAKKVGLSGFKNAGKNMSKTATHSTLDTSRDFIEERMNRDVPNKNIATHLMEGSQKVVLKTLKSGFKGVKKSVQDQTWSEIKESPTFLEAKKYILDNFNFQSNRKSFSRVRDDYLRDATERACQEGRLGTRYLCPKDSNNNACFRRMDTNDITCGGTTEILENHSDTLFYHLKN